MKWLATIVLLIAGFFLYAQGYIEGHNAGMTKWDRDNNAAEASFLLSPHIRCNDNGQLWAQQQDHPMIPKERIPNAL